MGATSSPLRFSLALEVRREKEKVFPASPPKPGKSALGTRLFWGVTFGPGIFVGVFEALVFFFLGGGVIFGPVRSSPSLEIRTTPLGLERPWRGSRSLWFSW